MLGAVAERTERMQLATLVTCPYLRYHPALVAQAAATVGEMSDGRFTLSVGAGERLNEHVVALGWPPVDVRHEMLAEAIQAIRLLGQGEFCTYRGQYIEVEDARIYTLPAETPDIAVAVSGRESLDLAVQHGDAIVVVEPDADLVEEWKDRKGADARVTGQVPVSWVHPTLEKEVGDAATASAIVDEEQEAEELMAEMEKRIFDRARDAARDAFSA